MKISLAPLQGYTDWVFRQAYQKYIGGVDEFYTPFLVLQNDGELRTSHKREVEPFKDRFEKLVPQFIGASIEEIKFFENYFSSLGYGKMNWNLGCPFPMLTKRSKGSGLLPYPDKIKEMLTQLDESKIELSVKMRLGLEDENEIYPVLKVLNDFAIKEVIVHPRIGKQLYKGTPNIDAFANIFNQENISVAYNGDLNTLENFNDLKGKFPTLNHVMIGRGVLKDYWLPHKIKGLEIPSQKERIAILEKVHNDVYELYSSYLSGDTQILHKMKPFWEYFSCHFQTERKVFKAVKKASGIKKYEQAVSFAFSQDLKE
nr:tRNA-dihydrouridine synthase family protein [uncultured Marinifilum sp.]